MHDSMTLEARPVAPDRRAALPPARRAAAMPAEADNGFVAMLEGYRPSGGLARSAELVQRLADRDSRALPVFARWVACGELVAFLWESRLWVPLFQFNADLQPRPEVVATCRELANAFDAWETAAWFITPNNWLDGRTPEQALGASAPEVLEAARADRFIACG